MDVHSRDLRYFVAVAQERHVTRAAARLHVSQPALSKQLRALERQVGATLLRRLPHGVELTPAGEALLPHAHAVLERVDLAAADVATAGRRLVVGVSTGVGRGLLPAVRSRVAAREPGVDPHVRTVAWDDPTAGLADGTSDVAVAWAPVPGRVRTLELAREPVVVALPPGHPLGGRAAVPFAAVRDEAFLALPADAGPLRAFWLAEAHREGPARVGAEIRSVEETHEALLDGRGVVLLAAGNAGALVRDGVTVAAVEDLPPCSLVLAWRHDDRRPAVRAYVDACREVVAARG
ncbi:LysR family transcriptional regulator [Actinomycetospora sp. NBRC 106375]|uniref:LysR family transcriptional regulator n=1 Tax=Actinomycetospora sp. NBRC 106375 TaxID=3032207 RepID=UPI0024A0E80F|nr:LysR family transcriptional regulator [Actinomycetospora sp. NBRC 106375]GLZ49494.1 LysR family transcriptional regulator [Actinomycetospora sp. NBRC 106375]